MDSKPFLVTVAVASLVWLLIFNVNLSDAQVTFSRDWNAGKRSILHPECLALRSTTNFCQMFINELREITNCELRALLSVRGDEDSPTDVFMPQRAG